jgi:hypothetical protein
VRGWDRCYNPQADGTNATFGEIVAYPILAGTALVANCHGNVHNLAARLVQADYALF